jgi:FAD/FMN-containing dehydrogenase
MSSYDEKQVGAKLAGIVGKDHVMDGRAVPGRTGTEPLKWEGKAPAFWVRPRTAKEIQKIAKLANQRGFVITPRSSTTPFFTVSHPAGNWILVDLSRMDSILKVDERNRAIMIEPGARWGPVSEEMKKRGLRPLFTLAPHKDKSVLTSFLEREPSVIPRFEYAEPILTMEIVLPNGDLFRTGSASGPAATSKRSKIDMVGPHGPSVIDYVRLFKSAQGGLGIATWINVKVEVMPSPQKIFFIPCRNAEEAVGCLYKVQRRQIGYECLALNRRQLANLLGKDSAGELAPWTVIICLGGGRRRPEEKLAYEERALREAILELGLDIINHANNLDASFIEILQSPWEREKWYKHAQKGDSADVFFITTMNRFPAIETALSGLASAHRIDAVDIGAYLQPLEYGRACHVEFSIPFDPGSELDGNRAQTLAQKSVGEIMRLGGFFSQPHKLWTDTVREESRPYTAALGKLKKIFDPNGVAHWEAL